ncbi:16S rRNA (cytidine1402-2'-O)-methyltransferase [Phyllobacterium sp. YR620]|uniref:16S rRNA (cytidine(1402)-2'-O)-methyltransferase n=1 Tax=Phyllobacterium sp. YR620 TaxID=1881066 RepID=UPI00088D37A8|nr:16S rRNA (cytidine(1402)-2'-O)-methyltransferase [Phyllobacterium sp. YR620]SDP33979.1 16S rRNA (cytidine1402-2'-O)-methyltransferase [Phyllobacterium sp. YR620]
MSKAETGDRHYQIGSASFRARPLEPALYIVATPIGNLGDMTIRGVETLAAADIIACEDTRVSRVLLERYGISRRPFAYHEHNAEIAGPKLIEALLAGKSVALVSDAGTPLVADPGGRLVPEAKAAGIRVVPIPGASSVLAALTASGLFKDSFYFAGFLSSKQGQRRARLAELKALDAALVFFESPNRAAATLADMADIFGAERPASLCRELTKTYETIVTLPLKQLAETFADEDRIRGEVVLVVGSPVEDANIPRSDEDVDALLRALVLEMSPAKAAGEAARMTGRPKGELYQRLLAMK